MTNRNSLLATALLCLSIATATSGCRLYGGHGTTESTISTLTEAFEGFSGSLAEAENGLERLQVATSNHPELAATVERFANVVEDHKHSVDKKALEIENVENSGLFGWVFGTPYRDASRLLGAVVSDNSTTQARYDEVLSELGNKIGAIVPSESSVEGKPYQAIPAYYVQKAGPAAPTIDLILNHLAN